MKLRRYALAGLVCAGLLLTVMPCVPSASATTYYYACYFPSAWEYWPHPVRPPYSVISGYDAEIWSYPSPYGWADFYYITPAVASLSIGDFTNPAYYVPAPMNYTLPDNDTGVVVTYVWAVAIFSGNFHPALNLSFSTNDRTTWQTQSFSAAAQMEAQWNITGLATWTPALIKSEDLWVKLSIVLDGSTHWYVDYIGLMFNWQYTPPVGDEGVDEDEGGTTYGQVNLDVVGSLGLVGVIGMIACPAYAVYQWKHGEPRIRTFVMVLAGFMFCFTMFLGSMA